MSYFGVPVRNGLPIGLGSVAGFGIAPFEPYSLFENGEQGAWYDPSDFSTLFTDSAGTTPVTAVEQFVGLMLDKSKGLVLGPELVTNGDFSNGTTGWTASDSTLSVVSGQLQVDSVGLVGRAVQSFTTVTGRMYRLVVGTVTAGTAFPSVRVGTSSGGSQILNLLGAGAKDIYFFATATTTFVSLLNLTAGTALYDNISVRELPGNHATSTGTKRPKLAARYNLLQRTEEFENAYWLKTNITVPTTNAVSPIGTNTADVLAETVTNGEHTLAVASAERGNTVAGTAYTFVIHLKKGSGASAPDWIQLGFTNFAGYANFNLSTGQVGNVSLGTASTPVDVGGGFWRIAFTYTPATAHALSGVLSFTNNVNTTTRFPTYAGNTAADVIAWGADLRPASQATGLIGPTYQRVAAATVYDTAGFLPYLQFDGIDDSMSTGSIDFTATDKMTVWAGVRKLSDAAGDILVESSSNVNTNNGSFFVLAPASTAPDFGFASTGTVIRDAVGTGFAAPITNVLTGIGDISGDAATLRVNGTQAATNTNDQGAGNYGNYPLFIGARNNASLFFNGWLTSLIVRGAQSTQSQIEATESWVNGKTGAY